MYLKRRMVGNGKAVSRPKNVIYTCTRPSWVQSPTPPKEKKEYVIIAVCSGRRPKRHHVTQGEISMLTHKDCDSRPAREAPCHLTEVVDREVGGAFLHS